MTTMDDEKAPQVMTPVPGEQFLPERQLQEYITQLLATLAAKNAEIAAAYDWQNTEEGAALLEELKTLKAERDALKAEVEKKDKALEQMARKFLEASRAAKEIYAAALTPKEKTNDKQ